MKNEYSAICEIFQKDFIVHILQSKLLARKDPMSLGTSNGNQLLYRYLFRHVEPNFGKIKSSPISSSELLDDNFEIGQTTNSRDTVLTSLSRAEYEIIISKFLKLQHFLAKENINPLTLLKTMEVITEEEQAKQNHLQNIYNFIKDKLEEAFIDSMSEYYLLDENQVDKLWRFGLLEYILIGSMSAFQANRLTGIIDEIVQGQVPNTIPETLDLTDANNQIVDVKKTPTQIYVTPKFEKETWNWQVEDETERKSKKD